MADDEKKGSEKKKGPEKKKDEKKAIRRIAPIDYWVAYGGGVQSLSIFLGYEDGHPVKRLDVRLIIEEEGAAPLVVDQTTNDSGFVKYERRADKRCAITIQAGGSQERVVLTKMRAPRRPPEVPEVPGEFLNRGFRATLAWYFHMARRSRREE